MDVASKISKLAAEFNKAISEPRINPNQLRAIYSAIERHATNKDKSKIFKCFNRQRKSYFVIENMLNGLRTSVPQFVQRKVANHSTKRLVGKHVLVQFLDRDNKGTVGRYFALAEVLKPEIGDDPKTVWVKISDNKKCAERYCGLTLELKRSDVLLVASDASQFLNKQEKWSY